MDCLDPCALCPMKRCTGGEPNNLEGVGVSSGGNLLVVNTWASLVTISSKAASDVCLVHCPHQIFFLIPFPLYPQQVPLMLHPKAKSALLIFCLSSFQSRLISRAEHHHEPLVCIDGQHLEADAVVHTAEQEQAEPLDNIDASSAMKVPGFAKVYWVGAHATLKDGRGRGWNSPLGKLHPGGLRLLEAAGWTRVAKTHTEVPVFSLATRRTADFGLRTPGAPFMRQMPEAVSDLLDDKLLMARTLQVPWSQGLLSMPATTPADEWLSDSSDLPPAGDSEGVWFLKHARGVKGAAVHPCLSRPELTAALQRLRNRHEFVVQAEVPPRLIDGRKFCVRMHVVVVVQLPYRPGACRGFVHRDVVALFHALPYDRRAAAKAVHVQQTGSGHPRPRLLQDVLGTTDFEVAFGEIQALASCSLRWFLGAARPMWAHAPSTPACLYQLFGCDMMQDAAGRWVLLECNAFPAIANGTMSAVDPCVYDRLIEDLLHGVVLPVVDGTEPKLGGLCPVAVEAALAGAS